MELALPLPIRGLIIGFTIAAAVGPITLLVVRRTIDHGGVYGFASGLGVATADATYGAIAAFGLTAITTCSSRFTPARPARRCRDRVPRHSDARSRPTGRRPTAARPGLAGAFASIYALTMTNPLTIVLYAGVFAGIGLAAGASFLDAAVLTLAVWAGSTRGGSCCARWSRGCAGRVSAPRPAVGQPRLGRGAGRLRGVAIGAALA